MENTNNNQMDRKEVVTLWGIGLSPYVRKAQIALIEKNIPYEHIPILPKSLLQATGQAIPADFEQASPLGKIPALRIGNRYLADSAVIAAYLDKKFPQGQALYPHQDSESYARALWFENYGDDILSSIIHKKIFAEGFVKPYLFGTTPDKALLDHAIHQELPTYLDYLEVEVGRFAWFAGDDFSMADVAIITHLISLEKVDVDLSPWKNLASHKEKVMARESFRKVA